MKKLRKAHECVYVSSFILLQELILSLTSVAKSSSGGIPQLGLRLDAIPCRSYRCMLSTLFSQEIYLIQAPIKFKAPKNWTKNSGIKVRNDWFLAQVKVDRLPATLDQESVYCPGARLDCPGTERSP